jgi:hypothetical protein
MTDDSLFRRIRDSFFSGSALRRLKLWAVAGLSACPLQTATADQRPASSRLEISETWEVAKVPADFRVGFGLLTGPERQYVAYYDERRRMTVAARELDSDEWTYRTLPSKVGWDSHNYVTLALDQAGHLHVSGNMHVDPLVYFRTATAGDIRTLETASMTGKLENRVTYPRFFEDADGRLVFTYRHGSSGNGINLYNRYNPETKTWSRLLEEPLFDGEGERNAYPSGPVRGPDGWFHVRWVWRSTPDCATNHHLSYARSRNLIQWESAFGDAIELPIRFDHRELLVDPIPVGGGIINGGHRMHLDSEQRPVIAYHKADADGNMQLYLARPQDGRWERHVVTDWQHPVPFSGTGSMSFIGIRIRKFDEIAPGVLGLGYRHRDYGSGMLPIDERTLQPLAQPVEPVAAARELPRRLSEVQSEFPGMEVRRATDRGDAGHGRYMLRWESLGPNRDKARKPPHPSPSTLTVHKLEAR